MLPIHLYVENSDVLYDLNKNMKKWFYSGYPNVKTLSLEENIQVCVVILMYNVLTKIKTSPYMLYMNYCPDTTRAQSVDDCTYADKLNNKFIFRSIISDVDTNLRIEMDDGDVMLSTYKYDSWSRSVHGAMFVAEFYASSKERFNIKSTNLIMYIGINDKCDSIPIHLLSSSRSSTENAEKETITLPFSYVVVDSIINDVKIAKGNIFEFERDPKNIPTILVNEREVNIASICPDHFRKYEDDLVRDISYFLFKSVRGIQTKSIIFVKSIKAQLNSIDVINDRTCYGQKNVRS